MMDRRDIRNAQIFARNPDGTYIAFPDDAQYPRSNMVGMVGADYAPGANKPYAVINGDINTTSFLDVEGDVYAAEQVPAQTRNAWCTPGHDPNRTYDVDTDEVTAAFIGTDAPITMYDGTLPEVVTVLAGGGLVSRVVVDETIEAMRVWKGHVYGLIKTIVGPGPGEYQGQTAYVEIFGNSATYVATCWNWIKLNIASDINALVGETWSDSFADDSSRNALVSKNAQPQMLALGAHYAGNAPSFNKPLFAADRKSYVACPSVIGHMIDPSTNPLFGKPPRSYMLLGP